MTSPVHTGWLLPPVTNGQLYVTTNVGYQLEHIGRCREFEGGEEGLNRVRCAEFGGAGGDGRRMD